MEWEKTDATTDEAPGKARAGEPTAARSEEPGAARAGEPTAAQAGEILKKAADTPSTVPGAAQVEKSAVDGRTRTEIPGAARAGEPGAARAGEPTAAQAGEILKKAADTPSTVPGAAQVEKSAVDGRTRTEIPGAARAGEPGAARMNEEPAAQSGTDGQDLESEAAQPDVGGASQAATNAPAVQTGKTTAAQAGETTASQAGESVKDAPAAQSKAATNAPAVQTGKPTAAQAGEPFAAQSGGRERLLWQLFSATLYISACTFGGGFVIVTFMRRRFVEQLHWLDEREMLDFTALAQSAPGAIAVNAAVLVGWRVAGFCGMLAAALGTVLPPMVILSVISLGYRAFADNRCVALALGGMQAGVAAVVLDVVCGLGGTVLRERSPLHIAVMAAAFIAGALLGVNVVYVILAAALAGVGHALLRRRARGARP